MPLELDALTASLFGRTLIGTGRTRMPSILAKRLNGRLQGAPKSQPNRIPTGTIWPDGSWTLGFKKTETDDRGDWFGLHPAKHMGPSCEVSGRPGGEAPLTLGNLRNSHKPPSCPLKPRGSKGITGLGRNMIRSAGALLNRHPAVGESTFCTITIPNLPQESRVKLVQCWPELVRQLIQRVVRQLEARQLPPIVLSVSEVQPKRLARSGEAYPHLHLLWPNAKGAKKGTWSVDVRDLKNWFKSSVERLVGIQLEHHPNTTVKPVRGSVAAYMSKYMSKGDETVSKARKDWGGYTIKQWWNLSGTARRLVKVNKKSGYKVGLLLETLLFEGMERDSFEWTIWYRRVTMSYNSGIVTVGWRGCLTDEVRRDLTAMLKSD